MLSLIVNLSDRIGSVCSVFFFKQKTAYEVRISDWSSDVCSSDLRQRPPRSSWGRSTSSPAALPGPTVVSRRPRCPALGRAAREPAATSAPARRCSPVPDRPPRKAFSARPDRPRRPRQRHPSRSEEHTSELQSLMRISYAVFSLKNKTNKNQLIH